MTSGDWIQGRLRAWARRKGISLQGSAGARGKPNYTLTVGHNVFGGGLLPEVHTAFEQGAGGELRGYIKPMQALHSSAAMAVNLLQHWVRNRDFKDPWRDIPACRALAHELGHRDTGFRRLAPAQLLRHILGLKFGTPVEKGRLVYLYLDAPGDEAAEHRQEIREFEKRVRADPVRFAPMAVHEFILRTEDRCRDAHGDYVDYLTERYL